VSGPRRRHGWMRSQGDGFRPIRQVGVAASIGLPLMVVGIFFLAIAYSEGETWMWIAAGTSLIGGAVIASSGRVV
jgi:hypothetical protein